MSVSQRARRWDVIMLGSALPGLAAAVRLARKGLRVLMVEEEAAAQTPEAVREPFFLPAGETVERCLRELGLSIIDRRDLQSEEVAYQILLPGARIDVGAAGCAEEMAAWGLEEPRAAEELMRRMGEAARAESAAMLHADFIRSGGKRGIFVPAPAPRASRGLPHAVAAAKGALAAFFDAQLAALSHHPHGARARNGAGALPREAIGRLLGCGFEGGKLFQKPGATLRGILRQRLDSLHGETRVMAGKFKLGEHSGLPAVIREQPSEIWFGHALVLNAPKGLLHGAMQNWGVTPPKELAGAAPPARRFALQLRTAADSVPEPLAPRAIFWDPQFGAIEVAHRPSPRGPQYSEFVLAHTADTARDPQDIAAHMIERLDALLPFGEEDRAHFVKPFPLPRPLWDDDAARETPQSGGWPQAVDIQFVPRRRMYALPRAESAGLGVEGDLLLGWRAADCIRDEIV